MAMTTSSSISVKPRAFGPPLRRLRNSAGRSRAARHLLKRANRNSDRDGQLAWLKHKGVGFGFIAYDQRVIGHPSEGKASTSTLKVTNQSSEFEAQQLPPPSRFAT